MSTEAQNNVAVYFERGLTLRFTPFDFLAHLHTLYIDLSTLLSQEVSTFTYHRLLQALQDKKEAGIIARWFRQQQLIPMYRLANELEPG